jgi:alpha-mannosidase
MNNYWETNYKASQEGPTTFRYAIRPHDGFDGAEATKFGVEMGQPLIPVAGARGSVRRPSLLRIRPDDVMASILKPSRDGKAWILRLFNPTETSHRVTLAWGEPSPTKVFLSDLAEKERGVLGEGVEIAPYEIVTIRAQLP